ncbi:hypothetical protein NGRA_0845 [Nosema granulosis]|uniref:Uncharacterized protein n=1 Tax=Nosema granulosis TaxID=83296 RepID=A0A9P6GZK3_9MICR|nr:hypothetical protein NGRA_0845 [Nosema granulosis]
MLKRLFLGRLFLGRLFLGRLFLGRLLGRFFLGRLFLGRLFIGRFFLVIFFIKGFLEYNEAKMKLDNIHTLDDYRSVLKLTKESYLSKNIYSEYVKCPFLSIPYYTQTEINHKILCEIIHQRILNLAKMIFYRIYNEHIDYKFVCLILKASQINFHSNIQNISHFVTVLTSICVRRFFLLCLLEYYILRNHWNNIKNIYDPKYNYFELCFPDNYGFIRTLIYSEEPFPLAGKYDFSEHAINRKMKEMFYYERQYLKANVFNYIGASDFNLIIDVYNSNKSLINYLFFYNGLMCVLEHNFGFEFINNYYILLSRKGCRETRVSLNLSLDLFSKGKYYVLPNIFNFPARHINQDSSNKIALYAILNKHVVITDKFELDYFLSLLQLYCEVCRKDTVVEILESGSKFVLYGQQSPFNIQDY